MIAQPVVVPRYRTLSDLHVSDLESPSLLTVFEESLEHRHST